MGNINNCHDCIFCAGCPCGHSFNNAACLTVRKSIEEFKKEIEEEVKDTMEKNQITYNYNGKPLVNRNTEFDTKSDTVTDEAVFASLWALKKYCHNHDCNEGCLLYDGGGSPTCSLGRGDSPDDFNLRENMVKKTVIWKD